MDATPTSDLPYGASPTFTIHPEPLSSATTFILKFYGLGFLAFIVLACVGCAIYWTFFKKAVEKRKAARQNKPKQDHFGVNTVPPWKDEAPAEAAARDAATKVEEEKEAVMRDAHELAMMEAEALRVMNDWDWDKASHLDQEVRPPPRAMTKDSDGSGSFRRNMV